MTLFLEVAAPKFRAHQKKVLKDFGNLVPVIKGNGYGFGLSNLVNETNRLKLSTISVGTVYEARQIEKIFKGQVLILEPYNKNDRASALASSSFGRRFIRTISDLNSGFDFKTPFVIEGLTSTNRFGIGINEINRFNGFTKSNYRGLALHLPIAAPEVSKVDQVIDWINKLESLTKNTDVWLSHISLDELSVLKKLKPKINFRIRVGTELWLGDKSFLTAKSNVLAVLNEVNKAGYTQKSVPNNKKLIVLSGGTAHGIGLNSDKSSKTFVDRLKVFGLGLLAALGKYRSPFIIKGKASYFFEPAHMNVSLVLVSKFRNNLQIGDEVNLKVRFTTTNFDLVKGLD